MHSMPQTAKDHEHSHSSYSHKLDSHHDQKRPAARHQTVSVEVKRLVEGVCSIVTVRGRTMLNANQILTVDKENAYISCLLTLS